MLGGEPRCSQAQRFNVKGRGNVSDACFDPGSLDRKGLIDKLKQQRKKKKQEESRGKENKGKEKGERDIYSQCINWE